jgi:hypothetical protein
MRTKRRAPRYAIMAGDFGKFRDRDGNAPRLVHWRVHHYLACWTDRNGWFKRRQHMLQADMAEEAGLSRTKFCGALADLVRWGFVEEVASPRDRRIYYYRVRLDRGRPEDLEEGEDGVEDGDLDEDLSSEGDKGATVAPFEEMSPPGDITGQGGMSPGGDINREQLCHQIEGEMSPGGDSSLYRGTSRTSDNPHTTTREARARVRANFGTSIDEIWDDKPDATYVLELLIGPLWSAMQRPKALGSPTAFLRKLREGIAARDLDMATLERARTIVFEARTVMPDLPQLIEFCEDAKRQTERVDSQCKRSARVNRADRVPADPPVAARTEALRERLRRRLGREVSDGWFAELECERIDAAVLTVSVPLRFLKNWIINHFAIELTECATAEFVGISRVEVVARVEARAA